MKVRRLDLSAGATFANRDGAIMRLVPKDAGSFARILKKARIGRLSEIGLTDSDIRHIKALYDCEIVRTDASVGALVDSLEAWGRLERAMIIITADHGEEFLEHGSLDHGQTLYDESLKVPLVIFAPACVDAGGRFPEQVGLIDIGPTPHSEHILVAYLPDEGILFEADHFTNPINGRMPPAQPVTKHLAKMIDKLGLDVKTIVGSHSPRIATIEDLRKSLALEPKVEMVAGP